MNFGGVHFLRHLAPAYGPHYGVAAQGCLRGMGLIYVISFWSLAAQVNALSGENGLLPAAEILNYFRVTEGAWAPLLHPTPAWIHSGSAMLMGLAAAGTLAGLCLLYGFYPWIAGLLSWVCWVSLIQICQPWFSGAGDLLTGEIGLLILLLIPPGSRGYPSPSRMGSRITGIVLLNALLFKVLFSSGVAKLLFGDANWSDATAFYHFFETQPLPTVSAWAVHHFPGTVLKYALWGVMFLETLLPFYIFLPRTFRNILAGSVTAHALLLQLTGHHGFLPLLMLVLAFALVDDVTWRKLLPESWGPTAAISLYQPGWGAVLVMAGLLPLYIAQSSLKSPQTILRPLRWMESGLSRVYAANRYALYTEVPETRREISLQGSLDGRQWVEYRFPLKPTDPRSLPGFSQLHLPRLDEALVFHARELGKNAQVPPPLWLTRLVRKLLVNDPLALSLFPVNPFPDRPPRFLRLAVYEYRFADPVARRNQTLWWERTFIGFYGPVFTLGTVPSQQLPRPAASPAQL